MNIRIKLLCLIVLLINISIAITPSSRSTGFDGSGSNVTGGPIFEGKSYNPENSGKSSTNTLDDSGLPQVPSDIINQPKIDDSSSYDSTISDSGVPASDLN